MKFFKNFILTLIVFSTSAIFFSAFGQTTITCTHNGDWDDITTWDLGRLPHSGDIVHIDLPNSNVTKSGTAPINIYEIHVDNNSTLSLNYTSTLNVTGLIHIDNGSLLNVNCPTTCSFLHLDNSSKICLNASFVCCYMVLDNVSKFFGNGKDVTISNCTNQTNPLIVSSGSKFGLDKDCNGNYVGAGNLFIKGNISLTDCSLIYNNITISNGTLDFGSCNVNILGKVTLNPGGDFTTTGNVTYGSNAQLVFNRSYILNTTQKVWATGTSVGVPPVVTIDSGVITTTDTFTVLRRINLLGGVVGTSSGTKIKLANDTEYICGGRFQSTPRFASNVVILTCSPIIISITSQTNVSFYGGSNGSVTLSASAGVAPYLWSKDGINYQSSSNFSGLIAGVYVFRCKDVNGLSATMTATITQPAQLIASVVSHTNETYYGGSTGSITVTATGGVGPYKWSKDGINFQSSATFSGLLAGTYTLTCKDTNGITATTSATITQPAQLIVSVASQTNVNCYGSSTGSVTVSVIGGVSPYTWSKDGINYQSSSNFSGLNAGAYTISCKDANNYIVTKGISITQPSAGVSVSLSSQTNILCYWQPTGSVTLSAIGGTGSYTWSKDGINFQSSSTFSALAAGTYTITAKDTNGCSATYSVTINRPASPFITSVSSQSNVNCYATSTGSISMTATGGVSPYKWSKDGINFQSSSTFSNLAAGSYTIKGKDANGCIETKFVTITQPASVLSASVSISGNCIKGNQGSATVTVTGGTSPYTYSWNTSTIQTTSTATNLSAGTYTVTVTDANGCITSQTVTINGIPQDFAYTTNYLTTTQSLSGNSFTFTEYGSSTGDSYNWDFGDGTTSTLASPTKSYSNYGFYNARLIATNTAGCSDTTYQSVVVLASVKSTSTIQTCACGTNPTALTQTIIFPTSTTDWSGTNLKIRKGLKFNSSIGTLSGVKVITKGSFTTHNKVEITGSMAAGTTRLVSIQTTGTMDCGGPGFLYGITPAMILDTFYSTGYDGVKDFTGTSGRDFGFHTNSIKDSTSFTDATTLASYTGNDSVSFIAYTNTNMSASFPTGNDTAVMQTTATDTITLVYYYCNPVISSIKTGNWNDPTTWDAGRVPTACDNVHVRNTDSITVTAGSHAICKDITCDGTSKLYIYDTLNCRDFIGDNNGNVTKVYGQLNVCSMVIKDSSNVYACSNINFSNCTNKISPLDVLTSGHLYPLGGSYCSTVAIKLKIDSGNVDLTNLCSANVGIQSLTVTNATVTLAACNNIVDYITLNTGGDCIGATPTWTGVSKLALNRNYNLDTTSILWQGVVLEMFHILLMY
jgi:hypothetical protein